MKRFKSDDLLVTILPVRRVEQQYGVACGEENPCTPYCTNTNTTTMVTRVCRADLRALRAQLRALQVK